MENIINKFEKYISYILIILLMVFISYQVLDLIWLFGNKIYHALERDTFEIRSSPGHPVAALFFGILITFEIIQTIRLFSADHIVKIRIILLVGLIAVTRKILLLDITNAGTNEAFSIAAMITALSIGYFLVGKTTQNKEEKQD